MIVGMILLYKCPQIFTIITPSLMSIDFTKYIYHILTNENMNMQVPIITIYMFAISNSYLHLV